MDNDEQLMVTGLLMYVAFITLHVELASLQLLTFLLFKNNFLMGGCTKVT